MLKYEGHFLDDIRIRRCISQNSKTGYDLIPGNSSVYYFCYTVNGGGTICNGNDKHVLRKNHGLIISPNCRNLTIVPNFISWNLYIIELTGKKVGDIIKSCNIDGEVYHINDSGDTKLENLIYQIYFNFNSNSISGKAMAIGYLFILFSKLMDMKNVNYKPNLDDNYKYIQLALNYIEDNISRNISVIDLARHVKISRSHLFRKFKDQFNMSPQEFIINKRIEKACDYLLNTSLSLQEISSSVGFGYSQNFSLHFKKIKGCSPIKYRRKNVNNNLEL